MIQSKSWKALDYGKKRKKIRTSRGNDGRDVYAGDLEHSARSL